MDNNKEKWYYSTKTEIVLVILLCIGAALISTFSLIPNYIAFAIAVPIEFMILLWVSMIHENKQN